MLESEKDRSYFLAFCIEEYKKAKDMTGAEVAALFFDKGVSEYLTSHFDVLHTQSQQWLIEEIDDFLKRKAQI